MPLVGLKEAARLTGKNQSTIHRAMKANRISFTLNDTGERMIDTAELDRVFSVKPADATVRNDEGGLQSHVVQIAELRAQLEAERGKAAGLQAHISDKDAIIADLREDRDHWRTQAETLLLSDQRRPPRRSWWPWGKR